MPRHENHWDAGIFLLQPLAQFEPGHVWQADIQNYGIRPLAAK
jgi:hypothetical protein